MLSKTSLLLPCYCFAIGASKISHNERNLDIWVSCPWLDLVQSTDLQIWPTFLGPSTSSDCLQRYDWRSIAISSQIALCLSPNMLSLDSPNYLACTDTLTVGPILTSRKLSFAPLTYLCFRHVPKSTQKHGLRSSSISNSAWCPFRILASGHGHRPIHPKHLSSA
jgi:hypothetical protein